MDYSNRDIIYAIRKIAGVDGIKKAQIVMGTVTAVNDKTCDVDITLGDACQSITGVNLNSASNDGFTLFPAVGSDILIALMPDNSAYMIACEDITKTVCYIDENNSYTFDENGFIFNSGTEGLMKIVEYTAKQNAMITALNTQLAAISAAIASLGGTYTVVPLNSFNKTDYEDTKIKH